MRELKSPRYENNTKPMSQLMACGVFYCAVLFFSFQQLSWADQWPGVLEPLDRPKDQSQEGFFQQNQQAIEQRNANEMARQVLFAPQQPQLEDSPEELVKKDANKDGVIDIFDLVLTVTNFGGKDKDINGDGTTDILDLVQISNQFQVNVVAKLTEIYGQGNAQLRVRVVKALGEIKTSASVDHLIEVVRSDKEADVRQSAVNALARKADPRAIPVFIEALGDDYRRVRDSARSALMGFKEAAVGELIKGLKHEKAKVGAESAFLLREMKTTVGSDKVASFDQIYYLRILLDSDLGQIDATKALYDLGDEEGIKMAQEKVIWPRIRGLSAQAYRDLVELGPMSIKPLIQNLQDPNADSNSRKWSARLLGEIGEFDEVFNILVYVISETPPEFNNKSWIYIEARIGLEFLLSRQSKERLLELTTHPNETVRETAVQVLRIPAKPVWISALTQVTNGESIFFEWRFGDLLYIFTRVHRVQVFKVGKAEPIVDEFVFHKGSQFYTSYLVRIAGVGDYEIRVAGVNSVTDEEGEWASHSFKIVP